MLPQSSIALNLIAGVDVSLSGLISISTNGRWFSFGYLSLIALMFGLGMFDIAGGSSAAVQTFSRLRRLDCC